MLAATGKFVSEIGSSAGEIQSAGEASLSDHRILGGPSGSVPHRTQDTPDETPIADTTALVVAIERDDTATTDVPSAFIIENEATMLVVGNDEQWGTISR